jgi:hypothetical protein
MHELKILGQKGAEPDKPEATEMYIRKPSTKICIAIQVVNTISEKISKLSWPHPKHMSLLKGTHSVYENIFKSYV